MIEDANKKSVTNAAVTPLLQETIEGEALVQQRRDIASSAGNAALTGIGDLTNGILRYVTTIAMTHMVTPTTYGIFNEVYTAMIILGWIAKLGFDGVLLCILPNYRVKNRQDLVYGLVKFAFWITLITGLSVGILVFALATIIARLFYHSSSYAFPLKIAAMLVPLTALQWVISAGLQAYKEIKWKVIVDRLSQPLVTLLALAIFSLLGWYREVLSIATLAGYFCSVLIGQIVVSKILRRDGPQVQPVYDLSTWFYTAAPMLFNGLIYGILNSADILFLSIFATPGQAAIYIAANHVNSLVMMPLVALNTVFSPLIAEYHASEKHAQLESMLKLMNKWSLSFSIPLFLACLLFHDTILGIFGPQYTAGSTALVILCVSSIVNAGTGSVLQLLVMTGHLRAVSINSFATISINTLLSFLLVPRLNILGAALATALATIILNLLCLMEVYWLRKIHPYRSDLYKPLLAGAISFGVGILLLHFMYSGIGRLALIKDLLLIVPILLIYGLIIVLLGFSPEDQIVIDAVRAKFKLKGR